MGIVGELLEDLEPSGQAAGAQGAHGLEPERFVGGGEEPLDRASVNAG